jgi:iron complex outermembrane receptor protein
MDGKYAISVPSKTSVLIFTYVGYKSKEIEVGDKNTVNVALQSDVVDIDQVVVVGYGVQKKADITGAVSSVQAEDLINSGATSPEQLLQGKLSGVRIVSNNGEPGAGVNISVRGIGSITSGMQPLYVIDGIPLDGRSTSPDGVLRREIRRLFLAASPLADRPVILDAAVLARFDANAIEKW